MEYWGTWVLMVKTRLEGSEFYISMRVTLPASSFASTDHIQATILQPADESGADSCVHGFVLGNQLCDDRPLEYQADGCADLHRRLPVRNTSRTRFGHLYLDRLWIHQPLRPSRPNPLGISHNG